MRLLSFRVQFPQLWLIYRCWVQFCTEKLENARRKLLKLGNKYSAFIPIAAIFILERNLIGADFDHVLGNHLWAMSARHAMNKSTLRIVIFVKHHLNTWFSLSLKLTFTSQNHYQKFSRRTACLGPCLWLARRARKERKLLARRENLLVLDDGTGVFSSPVSDQHFGINWPQLRAKRKLNLPATGLIQCRGPCKDCLHMGWRQYCSSSYGTLWENNTGKSM